jgi:hypothetical protein
VRALIYVCVCMHVHVCMCVVYKILHLKPIYILNTVDSIISCELSAGVEL